MARALYGRIGDVLVCGACLRFRLSPVHILTRFAGLCPGDKLPPDSPLPPPSGVAVFYDANGPWRSDDKD